jgi:hypothetical protein
LRRRFTDPTAIRGQLGHSLHEDCYQSTCRCGDVLDRAEKAYRGTDYRDFSGHWEGTVGDEQVRIEIDLTKNGRGDVAGTFGQPAQGIKALPLSAVAVEGQSVRFVVKGGGEPSVFTGGLAADGKSITGEVAVAGHTVPFGITRTGEARTLAVPKSSAIRKELEGVWNGTLENEERRMHLILTMTNRPDGTAAGTIVSPDGTGVEIPIAMTEKDAGLTVDVPPVGASFAGALNGPGTELAGTWRQGSASLPLTFRRSEAAPSKK